MTLFEDNPLNQQDPNSAEPRAAEDSFTLSYTEVHPTALGGDPISHAALTPARTTKSYLPEDLRISWSWPHFLLFVFFGVVSQIAVGIIALAYLSAYQHISSAKLQRLLESDPRLIVGTNVLWFGLVILFLYVTLALLHDRPFWGSLGWKKLKADPVSGKTSPWMYFFGGCGLAVFVAYAGSQVKNTEHVPIQELFQSRGGAMLLMAMAVLVAPLVEETVFRGYLYPLFAGKFSRLAEILGIEPVQAVRLGMAAAIFLTGVLFGLMHAPQLGWTWGLVSLLSLVGVIFTFARARTGTVVASFLLHLGYNSMIAVTSIIATKGFTHLPPVPR